MYIHPVKGLYVRQLIPFLIVLTLSSFAAWLDMINVLTYVGYELSARATEVGLVAIAMLLPHALFGRYFTKIAVRYRLRTVMLITLIGRALTSFALLAAPNIYVIIVILLVRSFLMGFMQPAMAAYASELAGESNVAGWVSLITTSSKLVAPAIGGVFSVTAGEHYAFFVSGVMCLFAVSLLAFLKDSSTLTAAQPDTEKATRSVVPPEFLWLMLTPVFFIGGLSNLFSNMIPYTFEQFDIPKLTLSLALSVSALGNMLVGAFLIVKENSINQLPRNRLLFSWIGTILSFLALTLALHWPEWALVLIPALFFVLSSLKTFYDISLNSFIFNQPRSMAATLSASRQSIMAIAGIVMTLIGSISMEFAPADAILYCACGISLLAALSWWWLSRQHDLAIAPATVLVN